jgi:nitroreductase
MLLAEAEGLASCWIGFAHWVLDRDDVKQGLGIAPEHKLVAPIILGHPAADTPRSVVPRKPFATVFVEEP